MLADTSMKVVLGMLFFSPSNANFWFNIGKLIWRFYTVAKALPTTSRVELINKTEFAKAAVYDDVEIFVIHVAALEAMPIYSSGTSQVQDQPNLVVIKWDKAPIKIPAIYADYADIFSSNLAMEHPKNTGINKHTIKQVKDKQPPYDPICDLSLRELDTLKTYIKTHLKTWFI